MILKMGKLVKLFQEAGLSNASKWDEEKMSEKVGKIGQLIDKDRAEQLSEDNQTLLRKIKKELKQDEPDITITSGKSEPSKEEDAPPKRGPGRPKGSGKKQTDEDEEETPKRKPGRPKKNQDEDEDDKPKKRKGKEINRKKDGVIRHFTQLMEKAGEKDKPISEERIEKSLKDNFPDRDIDSMMVTFRSQVPKRFRDQKGINVVGSREDGWMIKPGKKGTKKTRKDDDE